MGRWLPRLHVGETMLCHSDGESEGWEISVVWLGLTVELTLARRVRTVDQRNEAGA